LPQSFQPVIVTASWGLVPGLIRRLIHRCACCDPIRTRTADSVRQDVAPHGARIDYRRAIASRSSRHGLWHSICAQCSLSTPCCIGDGGRARSNYTYVLNSRLWVILSAVSRFRSVPSA